MLNIETFFNTSDVKRFYFSGRILWGKDCRNFLSELIESQKTIVLFVDAFFADCNFIKDFQQRFHGQIIMTQVIEGMPRTKNIHKILSRLIKIPDIVVSIGGGSTIDSAKAVIASLLYGGFDGIGIGERRGISPLDGVTRPTFICLPTTAGTGAEASRYYVVYDSDTHIKVHGKSWKLVADWILLDTAFMEKTPDRLLINSAFDAFIHFFESYLCRFEQSWFGDMLSLDGMTRIIDSLSRILLNKERENAAFMDLLYASTLSGVAISNIRTGIIHEAAGALLEHTELTHPETLFVFFRASYELYQANIRDRENMLLKRIRNESLHFGFDSFERVIEWWERIFELNGITADIIRGMKIIDIPLNELIKDIFKRVFSDQVWIEKESPLTLDENRVRYLIEKSLGRFRIGG